MISHVCVWRVWHRPSVFQCHSLWPHPSTPLSFYRCAYVCIQFSLFVAPCGHVFEKRGKIDPQCVPWCVVCHPLSLSLPLAVCCAFGMYVHECVCVCVCVCVRVCTQCSLYPVGMWVGGWVKILKSGGDCATACVSCLTLTPRPCVCVLDLFHQTRTHTHPYTHTHTHTHILFFFFFFFI